MMKKGITAMISGAAAAAVVGTAVYLMNEQNHSMKKIKRSAAKTVRAMGNIVDGVSEIIR